MSTTPKALATQIVLNEIKRMIETDSYATISELQGFKPSAVRQKLAALHNDIAKTNRLKDRVDEA